jgi:hypothetical protein
MSLGRIIAALVGMVAISETTTVKADSYRMLYLKGHFNPSFESCLSEKFSKRSGSEHFTETISFFAPIYNNTYSTNLFSHISAFRHVEIIDEVHSSLIITVAIRKDCRRTIAVTSWLPRYRWRQFHISTAAMSFMLRLRPGSLTKKIALTSRKLSTAPGSTRLVELLATQRDRAAVQARRLHDRGPFYQTAPM